MKTVFTTLPIYKALRDQCYERGRANGSEVEAFVWCPRHRLPSFQWIDDGDGATLVSSVYLVNNSGEIDITTYFPTLATDIYFYTSDDGDIYFIYNGATLNYALPTGNHYLKITMDNNYVYYSDWFTVDCVYCPVVTEFTNVSYDTFTGTMAITAVDAGANAYADSNAIDAVYLGQSISVIFFLTTAGATAPSFSVVSTSLGVISNVATSSAGLNELTLTTTRAADDCFIRISNTGNANFSTSEILVHTQYACGFVTLSFSNCCNLGDLLYEDDFLQTLWIRSDNIEPAFPYVEKGQENGEGKFIPTFRRQEKTYIIRIGNVTQALVDTLHRLKLHDVMSYVDQVGDAFNVENTDFEANWDNYEDKYYATGTLTIDLGEEIVTSGCCE